MLEAIKMYFLSFVITISLAIYLQGKILNKKMDYKKINNYIYVLIFIFLGIINIKFTDGFLRFFILTIILSFFTSIIFQEHLYNTFLSSLIQQFLMFLAEIMLMVIFSCYSINIFELSLGSFIGSFIINCLISLITIVLYLFSPIRNSCYFIYKYLRKLSGKVKYILLIFLLFTLNFYLMLIYFFDVNIIIVLINIIFIIVYSIIICFFLKEKNEKREIEEKNKNLINNLNEYEKMLDYQRVNNHENKNQLLVIKSMIEKKDKKLMEYINEIIKEKREDNEVIYNKTKRIPSGGLQGLIYQKMLLMQENNIEVNLDINSQVRKIDFGNLSSKMNYDICRIAGIIIDNAIEETSRFNKKEREIIISMYVDDMFIIEVSNRIKEDIDLSKIYERGYTNKEKGHGYGLSLLKKIVDENKKIENEVKIINNIFTQIIKIKM